MSPDMLNEGQTESPSAEWRIEMVRTMCGAVMDRIVLLLRKDSNDSDPVSSFWDGFELRRLIAEEFAHEADLELRAGRGASMAMKGKHLKDYQRAAAILRGRP
jgi:hypothetical protein